MSAGPFRLPLAQAQALAAKIVDDLRPVCELIQVAGSVRRRCETVGDIEIVCVPRYAADLFNEGHGQNLLDMRLVHLMSIGKLRKASDTPIHELQIKPFYIGSLVERGIYFKLEINQTDAAAWPVLLAIKTGPAEFSHKLVSHSDNVRGGFLPRGWRIADGWRVYCGDVQVLFESERDFIQQFCGQWIEPERRG